VPVPRSDAAGRAAAAARLGIDAATMRRLMIHEARVHALPGRTLRDIGDAVLLTDERDAEPFWNRLEAIAWPSDAAAFDRRLDAALVLFATLGRRPHVWPSPAYDEPPDLTERLVRNGFDDVGAGHLMVLADPDAARRAARERLPAGLTIERLHRPVGDLTALAREIAGVLVVAFEVDRSRIGPLEAETLATLREPVVTHLLARIEGRPAAVVRAASFDGCCYLSSIGTLPEFRGRGLARHATAAAAIEAVERGDEWVYLGVFAENRAAIRLYERLGFASAGGPVPDLLLIG
jgi:ribosomal protein S18 acetylase RimI-like enzyme